MRTGDRLFLTTTDGIVVKVEFLGVGGVRAVSSEGPHPWVEALESGGLYVKGSRFRTGWERLSASRPRKQSSQ